MNTFSSAVMEQSTVTDNGMPARVTTASQCVDFFFKAGASRGQNIRPAFARAFAENPDIAVRIMAWLRDPRGGAGERQLFRDLLMYLEQHDPKTALKIIPHVPVLGRWDDLLVFTSGSECQSAAFDLIDHALRNEDGLCAKWMPREKSAKSTIAKQLREYLKMDAKSYRKMLSRLTSVVESQMCSNEWSHINYSHVPSVAHTRYRSAFNRNDADRFADYIDKVNSGDTSVKINANAVYPHDVIKQLLSDPYSGVGAELSATELNAIRAQWDALPNYMGDANVLPMVDVSGSMYCPVGDNMSLLCMQVAVALGLYCSDKNTGAFKDLVLTFSEIPEMLSLKGDIVAKSIQLAGATWGFNTNLHSAMRKILEVAINGNVPQDQMPGVLLILSDMNFDRCVDNADESAIEMIRAEFMAAGYTAPTVAFWNLNAQSHVPVRFDDTGTALISGFSPSILEAVIGGDVSTITPETVMLDTVMKPKYNILNLEEV